MLNKRYHIHLICAPDDQISILDGLAIFMENRAFLTRDLNQGDTESAGYSRRCIDKCDYVLMLIGDSYGKLNNTGVSQLHLSYIYAKTKSKPILTLLKLHHDGDSLSRQLEDFISRVEKENLGSIYYYDDDVNIQEFIGPAYRKFIKEHTAQGWIKALTQNSKRAQTTSKMTTSSSITGSHSGHTTKSSTVRATSVPSIEKYVKSKSTSLSESEHANTRSINIDSLIMVNFSTHAYEGGNLTDLDLMTSVSWRQILQAFDGFSEAISKASFQRIINDMIHAQALPLAQEMLSDVHAVSRTQVSDRDLQLIQDQMEQYQWLAVTNPNNKSPKTNSEFVKITELGKKTLKAK